MGGKISLPTTNPMTIQEGRRAFAQAVLDNRVKARGSGCPHVNLLAQQPFQFNVLRNSPLKDMPGDGALTTCHHLVGPLEAANAIEDRETRDLSQLGFLCLPQTVASRVIGVHY